MGQATAPGAFGVRLVRISRQPRKGRQSVAHGASRGIVGTDRNQPRRGDRAFDRLWRCFLSPLTGLVGSNDPFHGLTPVAKFFRASGAVMLVRNAG